MGGIALLARELGYRVSGSDANVYPPMSTQLEAAGIQLQSGYLAEHLQPAPDCVVVGNAMSRGNPAIEYVLNKGLNYTSGPQWLAENVLQDKWVLAVSGTHGKTTTASLLAWILDYANMAPGFLIGGVPANFSVSARMGETDFFVVEADEYDTAFFDKRSKFVHYRPRTLAINNLEFDHADIFDDLAAIQRQFHHLVRCVPGEGLIIHPANVAAIDETLEMGCLGARDDSLGEWQAQLLTDDGSKFQLSHSGDPAVEINWAHYGLHNIENALTAAAAAHHVGVPAAVTAEALGQFAGVKRRMELRGCVNDVSVYDDFAHHPTAIQTSLEGMRARDNCGRTLAVIEPRSNTMRMGVHRDKLALSTAAADQVFWYQPAGTQWSLEKVVAVSPVPAVLMNDIDELVMQVVDQARPGDQIVVMSNGGFDGVHQKLLDQLNKS
ncbi:UNVERIFIED_CONTAM: hypothetical protein GTU68_047305 [Idotea baltica]|nr:hypothetical protein [Idotea baltica]